MLDRFSVRAKRVINLARKEAVAHNHEYLGTEHILLGLIAEGSGVAADVLANMGVKLHQVGAALDKIVRHGPSAVATPQLPFTPRAKKVLELAMEEAVDLGHDYVGTEHILLGLLKEHEGIAAQVLIGLHVNLADARRAVLEHLDAHIREAARGQ